MNLELNLLCELKSTQEYTSALVEGFEPEDLVAQSMPDASPLKWHLAHTAWFFEAMVLVPFLENYVVYETRYFEMFNSYYESLGKRFSRPNRGMLTRPTVGEVLSYRAHVQSEVARLTGMGLAQKPELIERIRIGIQHEQQHQELIVMDIKHLFAQNPLSPKFPIQFHSFLIVRPVVYKPKWVELDKGIAHVGAPDDEGFSFDNEQPRHQVYLPGCKVSTRLVTNRDYIEFIKDGGYTRPELWLSLGFEVAQKYRWDAPLYWSKQGGRYWVHDFDGMHKIDPDAPVCHVSYFEADAYTRYRGARLLTEFERETVSETSLADAGLVWEWTSSSYSPYPGYRIPPGAVGEYNGKFMCNQYVLRGGSIATPVGHAHRTYRNYFPPDARWQFAGIRIAMDV